MVEAHHRSGRGLLGRLEQIGRLAVRSMCVSAMYHLTRVSEQPMKRVASQEPMAVRRQRRQRMRTPSCANAERLASTSPHRWPNTYQ